MVGGFRQKKACSREPWTAGKNHKDLKLETICSTELPSSQDQPQ